MTSDLLILAQAAAPVVEHVATLSGNVTFGLAGAGAAIGIGLIGARATEAVGRNPGSFGRALTMAIIFTALAEAGTQAGFDFVGYCSQASFLIGNGLEQRLADHEARAADEAARYALRQQVKRLTLPDAMGERFQAIGFARDVAGVRAATSRTDCPSTAAI